MVDITNNLDMNCVKGLEITKIFPHPTKKDTNITLFAASSFEFRSKTVNFLIGVSGSGKTTLLQMIMGIEPITAGELFFNNLAIHLLKPKMKNTYLRKISYVSQFPSQFIEPTLTVFENIDYSLTLNM
ncbi:MAG: ATP-binding cassette domain-containing protein, partial [Candidatus Thorarchaeota archaeon]